MSSPPSDDSSASEKNLTPALPLARLSSLIDEKPEAFATGDKGIQLAALQAAKFVFDTALRTESKSRAQLLELLSSISPSSAPQTRSQTAASSGKRKRDSSPSLTRGYDGPQPQETPLSELSVEGMDEDQIWAQLELRSANICEILEFALETTGQEPESDEEQGGGLAKKKQKVLEDGDVDMADLDEMGPSKEEVDKDDDDNSDDSEEETSEDDEDFEDGVLGEGVTELRDPSDDEDGSDLDLDKPSFLSAGKRTIRIKPKKGGHPELDDGFFDLAAFNAETEEAESRAVSKGRLARDSDEDEDENAEEVDYSAAMGDGADDEDLDRTQELFYKDFFEPPAKVSRTFKKKPSTSKVRFHDEVRVKTIKPKGKNLPVSSMYTEEEDDDDEYEANEDGSEEDDDGMSEEEGMDVDEEGGSSEDDDSKEDENDSGDDEDEFKSRTTIERLKDDLFADEEDLPDTSLSSHQKRMASLRDEISSLEAENVAKKHWTLMGEAGSRARPVITEETVQDLEERIKARILEGRFDDVVRRRAAEDKPFLPSRFFELQDTKSKQSLAEIYEDEYTAAKIGGVAGEDRDGKLKKEHEDIAKLWDDISSKLDALCNAHFTPKAPKATISTIANISTATLESALPTTKATSTMLAPEEVFAPSSSDLRARSELTPQEKQALHNKQKKVKRKARDRLESTVDKYTKGKNIKKQKDAALKSIVKTGKGVTVIGKEGVAGKTKRP